MAARYGKCGVVGIHILGEGVACTVNAFQWVSTFFGSSTNAIRGSAT
jgi:hypothetical protein